MIFSSVFSKFNTFPLDYIWRISMVLVGTGSDLYRIRLLLKFSMLLFWKSYETSYVAVLSWQ